MNEFPRQLRSLINVYCAILAVMMDGFVTKGGGGGGPGGGGGGGGAGGLWGVVVWVGWERG